MAEIEETLEDVNVEIEVVLGQTRMPVHQLLRMGRGAVIELNATEADDVLVLANDVAVAKASIVVNQGHIGISVTKMLKRPSGMAAEMKLEGSAIQEAIAAEKSLEKPEEKPEEAAPA